MAIRPCAKSDRRTGDGNSDWSSVAAFCAPKFQLDDRRRLFYWYAQLKALERSFDSSTNHKYLISKLAEIERIEDAVSKIHFPLKYSDQVYTLRSHIDIVRRKIASRLRYSGRMAA
jgi:hypothetical protein